LKKSRLGAAFDDVAHLSARSGYRMHVMREVLANKANAGKPIHVVNNGVVAIQLDDDDDDRKSRVQDH
jgi:hypothetical protein